MAFEFIDFLGEVTGWNRIRPTERYVSQPRLYPQPLRLDRTEQWVTVNGQERELYLSTPELRFVIDRLALMFANGLWKLKDKEGNEIEKSPVITLLENPNVFQSRNEFLFQWFVQRCLYPSTFLYNLKGSALQDLPSAIWNLSPSRMVVNRTGKIWDQTDIDGIISGYLFKGDGGQNDQPFTTKDIIQFSRPDSDDPLMGISPLHALRMPISNIRASYGYRNTILRKKGAIGAWSSSARDAAGSVPLTPEENKQISNQLTDTYGIDDDKASVVVASSPLSWTPATYPTKDLMLFEEIDADKKAIIDMYGANEFMFTSMAKGAKYDNLQIGEKICYQDTIIPIAEDFAYGLSKRLGLVEQGLYLELCYEHISVLSDDEKAEADVTLTRAQAFQILVQNGFKPQDAADICDLTSDGQSLSIASITPRTESGQ
jgi:phage portal protein BeeE